MKANPERLAWIVLLVSFAAFCVIMIAVPLGVRWYLLHAQHSQKAVVESLDGTVVVDLPVGRGAVPISKGQKMVVPEGTVIRVDDKSEAVVSLFDHSFMHLFSGTSLHLEKMRSRRFRISDLPNTIYLGLSGGRVSIGTALALEAPLSFKVKTLHGDSWLYADGQYEVEVDNQRTEIATYRGRAQVSAAGMEVALEARQRTQIEFDQPPLPPKDVARNLVTNGNFGQPLSEGWRVFNDQGADGGDVDGIAELIYDEAWPAVRFFRTGGHGNHCETILEQVIDRPLPDAAVSLVVRATVKLRYQSLPGGGYLHSEYPLMIRLTYRDAYDSEAEWVQGFYYESAAGEPPLLGLRIPQDSWYLYKSGNLLEELRIKPSRITRLRVYASGWDYESLISDISVIVE